MEKFERDGVIFTVFEHNGETYLCTGEPTGEFHFDYAGEFIDYYTVVTIMMSQSAAGDRKATSSTASPTSNA